VMESCEFVICHLYLYNVLKPTTLYLSLYLLPVGLSIKVQGPKPPAFERTNIS
jgi:hypothetical protein